MFGAFAIASLDRASDLVSEFPRPSVYVMIGSGVLSIRALVPKVSEVVSVAKNTCIWVFVVMLVNVTLEVRAIALPLTTMVSIT
jgi:hypothetical protein